MKQITKQIYLCCKINISQNKQTKTTQKTQQNIIFVLFQIPVVNKTQNICFLTFAFSFVFVCEVLGNQ